MPPKRASSSSSASISNPSKKPKTDDNNDNPRSDRWSVVSGSGNVDANYKLATKDPIRAYSYVCICQPPFERCDDDEDEWESDSGSLEEDEDESASAVESKNKPEAPCDGGRSCLCNQSAADHVEHPWIITMAGFQKYNAQHIHVDLRDPDNFHMYTFNDHAGYGVLEVVQNLVLDFVEAEGNWKEQWAVCEAAALLLLDDALTPMMTIDDSDAVYLTNCLVWRMFLAMLAKLECQNLLKPGTEAKNLGVVMAMYIKQADSFPSDDLRPDYEDDEEPTKGSKKTVTFNPDHFDAHVLAYATKYNIKLLGPSDIDDLVGELEEVDLPAAGEDPWDWAAEFQAYVRDVGMSRRGKKPGIGGDSLDITTWNSAERKTQSFNKKDPLGKEEIDAIKNGMVLQMA